MPWEEDFACKKTPSIHCTIVKGLINLTRSQSYIPKTHPVSPADKEQGSLRKSLVTESLMSAHSFFLQHFLANTASHSQSLPRAAITLFLPIFVPPAQLVLNVRSKTNGLVTAAAAVLSCGLWPELRAAEGEAVGSQVLILSPPSILNRAWVPSKRTVLAQGWELQQKLVPPRFRLDQPITAAQHYCKEFCSISLCQSWTSLLCKGLGPYLYRHNLTG